ncbi:hypothetical protein BJ742DRAFT_157912 [Cladochytrium replicatum]|nr:hypothetical protein BJ742DRAFT_157912 [Cladochytrium replicatum]
MSLPDPPKAIGKLKAANFWLQKEKEALSPASASPTSDSPVPRSTRRVSDSTLKLADTEQLFGSRTGPSDAPPSPAKVKRSTSFSETRDLFSAEKKPVAATTTTTTSTFHTPTASVTTTPAQPASLLPTPPGSPAPLRLASTQSSPEKLNESPKNIDELNALRAEVSTLRSVLTFAAGALSKPANTSELQRTADAHYVASFLAQFPSSKPSPPPSHKHPVPRQNFEDWATTQEDRIQALRIRLHQLTIDHHLLISYKSSLPSSEWQSTPETLPGVPATQFNQLLADHHLLLSLHSEATMHSHNSTSESNNLASRLTETEARLKARDAYLHQTIMDTARKLSELEATIADLRGSNEELESQLARSHDDRSELRRRLAELEGDNLVLQSELRDDDVTSPLGMSGGTVSSGRTSVFDTPVPPQFTQGKDDNLQANVIGTDAEGGLLVEEYVLLRDIGIQTDAVGLKFHMGAADEWTEESDRSNVRRSGSRLSLADSMRSGGSGHAHRSSSALGHARGFDRGEQHVLSLMSRLTLSSVIQSTLEETISALESRLSEAEKDKDTLTSTNHDLKLAAEQARSVAAARDKVIEALLAKIERLESNLMASRLERMVVAVSSSTSPTIAQHTQQPSPTSTNPTSAATMQQYQLQKLYQQEQQRQQQQQQQQMPPFPFAAAPQHPSLLRAATITTEHHHPYPHRFSSPPPPPQSQLPPPPMPPPLASLPPPPPNAKPTVNSHMIAEGSLLRRATEQGSLLRQQQQIQQQHQQRPMSGLYGVPPPVMPLPMAPQPLQLVEKMGTGARQGVQAQMQLQMQMLQQQMQSGGGMQQNGMQNGRVF